MYLLLLAPKAEKDVLICERVGFKTELDEIKATLRANPRAPTQHFKRLKGHLKGAYSRRIHLKNRVVYTIGDNINGARDGDGNLYEGIVLVHRAWAHEYDRIVLPS